MKINVGLLFLFALFCGCASLSKTQVDAVRKYAGATKVYAAFPGKVVSDYVDLQEDLFLLTTPLKTNSETAVNAVLRNHEWKNECKREAEKMDLGFQILKKYAEHLELLATTDYNAEIRTNAESLKTNMDTLIGSYNLKYGKAFPKFGSLTYKAVSFVGRKYVECQRAEAIKLFVEKGNTVICELSVATKDFVENTIRNSWMITMKDQLKINYLALRKQILRDTSNYSLNMSQLKALDKEALVYFDRLDQLNESITALSGSLDNVCKAHAALAASTRKREKNFAVLSELKDFYTNVEGLMRTYERLK